ncbi:MAG TPA: anhydro-N-acetylmuramic acid kinase [Candidatus Megaira endosymbiont of Hartmannula sinica]|nr:anhydro-N-acetylmuramic acid kinase [Candidatus Megaera endosymbiont of Hartmannula sinica]
MRIFIGLMSGTSVDGLDASIIRSDGENFEIINDMFIPFNKEIKEKVNNILELVNIRDTNHIKKNSNLIREISLVEKIFTEQNIEIVSKILNESQLKNTDITSIGFHGQTIYHNAQDKINYCLGDANYLANSCMINVIHNFRKKDLLYGGCGAPLMPIYHKYLIESSSQTRNNIEDNIILNIGGVANITYFNSYSSIFDIKSFDCGVGNYLIDYLWLGYSTYLTIKEEK